MVFAEIEGQLRTEGGWNMHIAIALIMALLVTAGVLWFFFAPRKAYSAPLRDGVQEAVVEVKGGYNPAVIEAEAGMPLRLISGHSAMLPMGNPAACVRRDSTP